MAALNLCTGMHCNCSLNAKLAFEQHVAGRAPMAFPDTRRRRALLNSQPSVVNDSILRSSLTGKARRGVGGRKRPDYRRLARFQQFRPSNDPEEMDDMPDRVGEPGDSNSQQDVAEDERDDKVLPKSLEDTLSQASESAALFVTAGGDRAVVELIVPQVQNLGEEGDQQRLWNLSRLFLDELQSRLGSQQMKAVFPDAGVAAMIQHQWKDSTYKFASLNDRKPISPDDEVVVLIQPDYQMLSSVERVATALRGDIDGPPRPLIMYNPSLQSGEVGIGLNVRRMREYLLGTFTPVYSMRSLPYGAVFRRYPGPWQVFFDDEQLPGRYRLASETPSRPNQEDIEGMYITKSKNGDEAGNEPGPLDNLRGVLTSMNRFMKSLSR